jgi:hypothetical protein
MCVFYPLWVGQPCAWFTQGKARTWSWWSCARFTHQNYVWLLWFKIVIKWKEIADGYKEDMMAASYNQETTHLNHGWAIPARQQLWPGLERPRRNRTKCFTNYWKALPRSPPKSLQIMETSQCQLFMASRKNHTRPKDQGDFGLQVGPKSQSQGGIILVGKTRTWSSWPCACFTLGKTRTWSSNSKWVKHAHKTVEIYYIVRRVHHVRVLPRPPQLRRPQKQQIRNKQDWKSFQSLPASIILVYCIGSNMG